MQQSGAGLQSRQFHANPGDAKDRGAVVADQLAREADQDRREGRPPRSLCDVPYVDGPLLARRLQCFDQIACVHMSGLFVRSHMNAGQDGFRDESSKQMGDLIEGHWNVRNFSRRGAIDQTICSSSCKFWHQLSTVAVELLPVSGGSLGCACQCGGRSFCGVVFPRNHQFPGDARHLVGQCHGGQFRRLAFEEFGKPR